MLVSYDKTELDNRSAHQIAEQLERGDIIFFPECPIPLPDENELATLREELPRLLKLKNISYHPEADSVSGLDKDHELYELSHRVLVSHSRQVEKFLHEVIPELTPNWTVGTSSFRPMQEKGRNLKAHASNELIHVDAGAYGATNGDRILRFFVNVNPHENRVWATKGSFGELYQRYGEQAGIGHANTPKLVKGPMDHLRTFLIRMIARIIPIAGVLDGSPFDRTMRKFHNFMKDTPAFQSDPEGRQELQFPPYSAWMVLTDTVSHASLSGQHALVNTFILRLENCLLPECAPINIMRNAA